jgi:hypothetical protein
MSGLTTQDTYLVLQKSDYEISTISWDLKPARTQPSEPCFSPLRPDIENRSTQTAKQRSFLVVASRAVREDKN